MKLAIAATLAAFSLAGAAFAETSVTATLDQSHPSSAKFIAAHAVWNCAGATCVASIAPDTAEGVSGCADLAKKIGRVTSYATERRALDAKGLERCNKSAAGPAEIGTASR